MGGLHLSMIGVRRNAPVTSFFQSGEIGVRRRYFPGQCKVTSRVTDGQAKNQVKGANERNSEQILIINSLKQ